MTPTEFTSRLHASARGARITYHRGELAGDRLLDKGISKLADAVYAAAEIGACALCQTRRTDGGRGYNYVAVKR